MTGSHEVSNFKFVNEIFAFIARHQEKLTGNGWLEMDLTELLPKNNRKEINFEIECFSLDSTTKLSFEQVGIVTNGYYQPFLVSKRRSISKRIKRQAESTEDEEDLGPYLREFSMLIALIGTLLMAY